MRLTDQPHKCSEFIFQRGLLLFLIHFHVIAPCPKSCQCSDNSGGVVVHCSSRNLEEIPIDLPMETVSLKLDANRIHQVPNNAFKDLTYLQELDLSKNSIEKIELSAFKGVADGLRLLDLSGNQIHSIPKEALANLKGKIRLSSNPLHCDCSLQEMLRELNLDPDTVNDISCETSVLEEYVGKPLIQVLDSGINFCNIHHRTTDVAMFITMFGWFTMVITYVVYYVRHNQEDARRHLEYLKSLPSTQITKDFDTISTVL
ncbi:PREDICTED: leucine-rich repeat-containing protein 3-like [Nanorana parkeri]|uniref:leucine-rich repeat-containing protein 3-like n=1 Tax=Nanorana parkeri TaxID=125878 RepID=UPI0008542D26|nr:PREDICTED: leucine-rich repeat-containing protein 3-like [Nanorana parkeri]